MNFLIMHTLTPCLHNVNSKPTFEKLLWTTVLFRGLLTTTKSRCFLNLSTNSRFKKINYTRKYRKLHFHQRPLDADPRSELIVTSTHLKIHNFKAEINMFITWNKDNCLVSIANSLPGS